MTHEYWVKKQASYTQEDWATKPSLFAEAVTDYLPPSGKLLEFGAGVGQDSVYFSKRGYKVTATDLEVSQLLKVSSADFAVKVVDLQLALPFPDSSFDIVYAHLSLHYFDQSTTHRLFAEIYRVLQSGGILAFFANSTSDPEYGTGRQLEPDYFEIDGITKRFFRVESARSFASKFTEILADDNGETYKDTSKGIHNLIRYIGTKK